VDEDTLAIVMLALTTVLTTAVVGYVSVVLTLTSADAGCSVDTTTPIPIATLAILRRVFCVVFDCEPMYPH
jgi:hypothetical protein